MEANSTHAPEQVAVVTRLDPQALIAAAVSGGSSIETLERLVTLAKDVQAHEAKAAWHRAMAEFQRQCPPIRKTRTARITTRTGGGYQYSYAPLGEIMDKIAPVMGPLGLSVSYRVSHEPEAIVAVARVSHELGHYEESGPVRMPVAKYDGTGANQAQLVGIASTYAKRYALLAIIGLSPEDDPDARGNEPPPMAEPQRRSAAPAPEYTDPPKDDAGIWRGRIIKLSAKTGKKRDGNPWTLWTAECEGGSAFGTFSADMAEAINEFITSGAVAEIRYETTSKGNRNIVSLGQPSPELPLEG